MSLLIDALRKAEQERGRAEHPDHDLDSLTLEPMSPPQDLNPAEPDVDQVSREAAANLFAVKQTAARPGRLAWFALVGIAAGVILAAYVWWQMQPSGLAVRPAEPAPPMAEAPPRPLAPLAREERLATAPTPLQSEPVEAPAADRLPPPEAPVLTAAPAIQRGELGVQPPSVAAPKRDTPASPRVIRSTPRPERVPEVLAQAYAAYSAGRLEEAAAAYRMYLQRDPNSGDALNGLGAIALESGQATEAAEWFRRAIDANPDDPVAQAGLVSANPSQALEDETRLRGLITRAPESPEASFALGNALARQNRWAEAQQAYFSAHTGDPGNPDFLFNLAVSLDQLGQAALARDFYRRALSAAQSRPAVFDPAPVRTRLAALEGTRQ